MEQLHYGIKYDESLSRWRTGTVGATPFASPRETFEAPVNMGEAYVQIVYPVRKAFLAQHDLSEIPMPQGPFDNLYIPFENNRVDFTTFIKTPHHLEVEGISWLCAPEEGDYPFSVYTCGGLKLWLNGNEVLSFAPFTRNIPAETPLVLHLKKGINEIRAYADELAERDVFFYFELRYRGKEPLEGVLEIEGSPEDLEKKERFLRSCYFPRDCLSEGTLSVYYDNTLLDHDLDLVFDSRNSEYPPLGIPFFKGTAKKSSNHTDICPVENDVGFFKISIDAETSGHTIKRELVIGLRPGAAAGILPAESMPARKIQALDFICDHGESVVNRAMAICERKKEFTQTAEACLRNSLTMIDEMGDCADFYLVPLLLFLQKYPGYIPSSLEKKIKSIILKFRYWIDEPGNDVMWYFSENHAFLFHTAQYLAGYMYPDETFSASGRKGIEQSRTGKDRVIRWFGLFFEYGFAEWNSATYIPIDLLGFFVLYEMAPDAAVREMAGKALDFTFKIIAYNSFNGVMSSSYGRSYEHTLKSREQVETSFIEWVAYKTGFVNFRTRAVALFCLSSYEPPPFNLDVQCGKNEWMTVEFDQGMNNVKTYSYRTGNYFLASVRRFKPFFHGHQQHLMNAAFGEKSVQYYINHPGERAFSGGNRPSYWAGNGTVPFVEQYQGLAAMVFNTNPNELVHYIHAYATLYAFDEYEINPNWFFFRVDDAYCATWFSQRYEVTDKGANTGKELVSPGLNHGVIIRCGSGSEWNSFGAFMRSMKQSPASYDGRTRLEFSDPVYGYLSMNAPERVSINGRELPFSPKKEMDIQRGSFVPFHAAPGVSHD